MADHDDIGALLAAFREAALEAGEAILPLFRDGCGHRAKADASPVTEADHAAEAIILGHLARACPDVPVVAEEEIAGGHVPAALGNRFILVDPLDGTREFVSGRGEFTVNIALVENGRPVAGVVFAPVPGELFLGSLGRAVRARRENGAFGADETIRVRAAPAPPVAVASRSHRTPDTDRFIAGLGVEATTPVGSSLKFCRVAEGTADVYPCFGRTMEWDTAAGQAVLEAAGGHVLTAGGAPLGYGKRDQAADSDFANPPFVAAGTPALASF